MPGTKWSTVETRDTAKQARGLSDAIAKRRLSTMLQSISQRYSQAKLMKTRADFGVVTTDGRYLSVQHSGPWTAEDLADLLELFAAWLRVDPEGLAVADPDQLAPDTLGAGPSATGSELLPSSDGPCCRNKLLGLKTHGTSCPIREWL